MKILAIEHDAEGTTDAQFGPHLKSEASRAWQLYQSGAIRELYFRRDREEAVLILECTSMKKAKSILNSLPLVQAGLISFEVIPLKPYPGFEQLFRESPGKQAASGAFKGKNLY